MGWTSYGEKDTENRESFAAISALRAAALRRLRSETRLRAQCGRRVTLPMAARRRKVHSTPFPPDGENCVRSLAPPLPGKPASLGFAGNNEGLGKTPPGTRPMDTSCP